VIGISPDPVEAVSRFADKHGLGFTLLADADHRVAEAFGTWVEKRNYGRTTGECSGRPL
jgi:thioredoxin-dependent peroxiredoxin